MKIQVKITRKENADYYKCAIGDIIEVEFEEYVAAVVASEIGNSNLEACKAQAIAARTYGVNRGVLNGKIITDDSATAQAYRAPRYNFSIYPNCIQAAADTSGLILTYNNKPIDAVYSDCNGGHTYSANQVWGGNYPYLIERYDPWDSSSGKKKNGHGVGMSQTGAIYAGKNGFSYKDILAFYYPGTKLININKRNKLIDIYNSINEIINLLNN